MANDLFATCDRGLVMALSDLDLEAVKYSRKPLNRVSNYESKKINLNLNLPLSHRTISQQTDCQHSVELF